MILTSPHNPRVKEVMALRERRERDRTGLMLVEGYEEILLARESGVCPVTLLCCAALFGMPAQGALAEDIAAAGGRVVEVDERVFRRMAYREGPDGWLAVVPAVARSLGELHLSAAPCVVVAEAVEKPGNLGAILRSADAAGADAVVAADPRADWSNPNVVRASKGAVFSIAVATASTRQTVEWLTAHDVGIVAATPEATMLYTQADLRGPTAIVVGTEKQGLSQDWLDHAQARVRIPMTGRVNSLNVATAAALLLFEVVRQRAAAPDGGAGRAG